MSHSDGARWFSMSHSDGARWLSMSQSDGGRWLSMSHSDDGRWFYTSHATTDKFLVVSKFNSCSHSRSKMLSTRVGVEIYYTTHVCGTVAAWCAAQCAYLNAVFEEYCGINLLTYL